MYTFTFICPHSEAQATRVYKESAPGYFEEAIKKILTKTKEVNLEELVRNFIDSKSQLKTSEATAVWHCHWQSKSNMISISGGAEIQAAEFCQLSTH